MASPEESPRPKRSRVDRSGPTSAHFLYFGLSFIWEELFLKEPPNRLPLKDLPTPLVTAIQEDLKRFQTGGFPKSSSSLRNTCFKRVEDTDIWLFQHAEHGACSAVLFEHFYGAFANTSVARTECDDFLCCLQTQDASHFMLEPYFCDNVSLQRRYTTLSKVGDLSEQGREVVGQLLGRLVRILQTPSIKPSAVPEEFSTGGAPLNVKGYIFNENIWSLRLTGCLNMFLPQHFDVKMTGTLGLEFAMNQLLYTGVPVRLCQCYPFQGAPDITIREYPIVLDTDPESEGGDEGSESGTEPAFVIENAQQAPRQVEYPPKLGELLANMHIGLMKKVLREFIQKNKQEELKLVSRGLLLHKATGGIMCEVRVEVRKNESVQLAISVDDFSCALLTPSALCHHLQRLLKCDLHK